MGTLKFVEGYNSLHKIDMFLLIQMQFYLSYNHCPNFFLLNLKINFKDWINLFSKLCQKHHNTWVNKDKKLMLCKLIKDILYNLNKYSII